MKSYDILIIGAGPGGIGAAAKAASLGMKAAVIERRGRLSPLRRACSEGLLYEEFYFGDSISINKTGGCIDFRDSGLSLTYTGETRGVESFINISPSGSRMKLVREGGGPIHLVFDKCRYIEENLERARAAGVDYFPGQSIEGLKTLPDAVEMQTSKDSFRSRFLVAADGLNSSCSRLAGFEKERIFYGTVTGACWLITGFDPGENAHIHLLEGSDNPSIFCICPRVTEGQWSVMISGCARNPDYEKRFGQVLTESVIAKYFQKVRVLGTAACVLSLRSPIENPCRDNVFIVGDAAWFGQTSNTHAALTGAKAVECIYAALQGNRTGDDVYEPYRAWWSEHFTNYLRVPSGANMFELLSADELDRLFSYMPESIPASMEPKASGRLLGAFFQKLLPEIMKKDPELVQKIAAIQQLPADTVWADKQQAGFPLPACC